MIAIILPKKPKKPKKVKSMALYGLKSAFGKPRIDGASIELEFKMR